MIFNTDKQKSEWLKRVQRSSIPLRRLDNELLPIGLASACLIDYLEKRILLTVFHAVGKSSRWVIQLKYDIEKKRTETYSPLSFNFLAEMRLGSSEINDVDFAYAEVPKDIEVYFQHLTPTGECIEEFKRTIFAPNFNIQPSVDEIYGFSGEVLPDFVPDLNALIIEHRTYPGLKYMRTENGYHFFKLPVAHPGHEHFQGCSGAPIIDSKGHVVALVCSGSEETHEIRGVALNKYKIALDVTYGKLLKTAQQINQGDGE
jgi:hypothetical protein